MIHVAMMKDCSGNIGQQNPQLIKKLITQTRNLLCCKKTVVQRKTINYTFTLYKYLGIISIAANS